MEPQQKREDTDMVWVEEGDIVLLHLRNGSRDVDNRERLRLQKIASGTGCHKEHLRHIF